ncbi:TPA: phage tail protein, partial [Escherichia coli]|nr:phage tail protein [Escherichia coli]
GKRTSYLDCFTVEVGEKYTVDSEAKIDIKMAALRKVTG